jgi:hypothetical protein
MHADPPANTIMLIASSGAGPTDGGSYGTLCLDFPPTSRWSSRSTRTATPRTPTRSRAIRPSSGRSSTSSS